MIDWILGSVIIFSTLLIIISKFKNFKKTGNSSCGFCNSAKDCEQKPRIASRE